MAIPKFRSCPPIQFYIGLVQTLYALVTTRIARNIVL